MSGQATGWVLRHGPKNRAMRAVLLAIADAANRDGENAKPGLEAVIEGSLYKRSQVFAITKKLVAEGWLEVQEPAAPGRVTTYRLPMMLGQPVQKTDPSKVQSEPDPIDPAEVVNASDLTGQQVRNPVPATSIENKSTEEVSKPLPSARKEIERALLGVCGLSLVQMTRSEKRKLGVASSDLAKVGATPAEVSRRARIYRRTWRKASLTPMALSHNWNQLIADQPPAEPKGFDGVRDFLEVVDG